MTLFDLTFKLASRSRGAFTFVTCEDHNFIEMLVTTLVETAEECKTHLVYNTLVQVASCISRISCDRLRIMHHGYDDFSERKIGSFHVLFKFVESSCSLGNKTALESTRRLRNESW
jgi:hypothetical protein